MKAINFEGVNGKIITGTGEAIPALKNNDMSGIVVVGYKLNWKERLAILLFGKLWFSQVTNNAALRHFTITVNKYEVLAKVPIKPSTPVKKLHPDKEAEKQKATP